MIRHLRNSLLFADTSFQLFSISIRPYSLRLLCGLSDLMSPFCDVWLGPVVIYQDVGFPVAQDKKSGHMKPLYAASDWLVSCLPASVLAHYYCYWMKMTPNTFYTAGVTKSCNVDSQESGMSQLARRVMWSSYSAAATRCCSTPRCLLW